jgi:hybrid cluster-associated redox disulfide protein
MNLKGETKMAKITADMLVGEVLDAHPELAKYFLEIGMHCLGCPMSRGESIKDACSAHGQDAEALLEKLNAAL